MQPAVDHDAVRAPEGIVELNQARFGKVDHLFIDRHFFAPERPPFIKNRVMEQAPEPARVALAPSLAPAWGDRRAPLALAQQEVEPAEYARAAEPRES